MKKARDSTLVPDADMDFGRALLIFVLAIMFLVSSFSAAGQTYEEELEFYEGEDFIDFYEEPYDNWTDPGLEDAGDRDYLYYYEPYDYYQDYDAGGEEFEYYDTQWWDHDYMSNGWLGEGDATERSLLDYYYEHVVPGTRYPYYGPTGRYDPYWRFRAGQDMDLFE